jgi:Flp pilus assembly pilin Flp
MLKTRRGATATEYGLIASLIAVVSIAALSEVGSQLKWTMVQVGFYVNEDAYWENDAFATIDSNGDNAVGKAEFTWFADNGCQGDCPSAGDIDIMFSPWGFDANDDDKLDPGPEWDGFVANMQL